MYKNIVRLDRFVESANERLEIEEGLDKQELKKDFCIRAIETNKDFFSQITKDEAFYFVNKLRFVDYRDDKADVASKLVLTNENFLPINSNKDLVEIAKGFNLSSSKSKFILINSLIKSEKTDFFNNIDIRGLCRLLEVYLKIVDGDVKIKLLEIIGNQSPNLFEEIYSPIALAGLFRGLNISFDQEKYELIKLIASKKDIFINVKDIYDACSMISNLFSIRSNSVKHSLLTRIIESSPEMLDQIESIDDLLKAIKNLNMGQNPTDLCKFCELLIADKPEILGSVSNIERMIEQVDIRSNSGKQLIIEKAISLQKTTQDKLELTKDAFKNFIFLSYQSRAGADLIKESMKDFDYDKQNELIQFAIDIQSPWNRGNFIYSLISGSAINNKELFFKLDFANINNNDLFRIFNEAMRRMDLSHFEILKFSKLVNCEKYDSIREMLEKRGVDGIFKQSKISEINEIFNPHNDNDFDINRCRAIDFLNYLQLVGDSSNFHNFCESNYLKQLKDGFLPRTKEIPIHRLEIENLEEVLKAKNLADSFIKISEITSIFKTIISEINDVKVKDVASLTINEEAKTILSKALKDYNQINRDSASRFFNIILGEENNLDFSQENKDKLCYFLQKNSKDLCALLKHPQGLQSLHNAIYSVADGCVANIGNQMKMMVLKSLIENREGKNAEQMLKIYQSLVDNVIVPLINSDSDFIGDNDNMIGSGDMELYYIAPTDFFRQVANKFNGSNEVHGILAKEMGSENSTNLMIKSGVCDEDLSEFDEEKANYLGAYQAIKTLIKKEEFAKILTKSEIKIKNFCNIAKEAEKSISQASTPSRTFTPLARMRNLRDSASNLFQRFANR